MKEQKYSNKRALIEAALIASIATFFAISFIFIPILSLLLFLLPVPFLILSSRHGTRYTVLSLIIASILIGVLTEIVFTLFVIMIFGPMAIIMGYYIKRNREPYAVIGFGAVASIISIFATVQLVSTIGGFNIINSIEGIIRQVVESQGEMLMSVNLSTLNINEMANYLLMIIPGMLVVQALVSAFLNYYLTVAILRRLRYTQYSLPEFSNFILPKNIVLGSFIIYTLTLLSRYVKGIYHTSLMANATILFVCIFFLQGLALISYMLKKVKILKLVRIFIIILIVLISPLLTIVSFAGLIDSVFDIRKLRQG